MNESQIIDKLKEKVVRHPTTFRVKTKVPDNLCRDEEFLKLYNELKALKSSTANIDFNCGFDEHGVCAERRRYKALIPQMCCCITCVIGIGYLRDEIILPDEINFYKKKFNPYLGFWQVGKGCTLPREMRSITCVFYHCYYCGINKSDRNKLNELEKRAYRTLEKLEDMIG